MTWAGVVLCLLVFLTGTCLIAAAFLYVNRDQLLASARIRRLIEVPSKTAVSGLWGRMTATLFPVTEPLQPAEEAQFGDLNHRLQQAGFYDPAAVVNLLRVRTILLVLAVAMGLVVILTGILAPRYRPLPFVLLVGVAILAPGLWLDSRRRARQSALRRALPDALDMLVLCMEGGLSLNGSIQRVTAEMQAAHPELGRELLIAEREVLLGQSTGEALMRLAQRVDLEEARSLAAIVVQAERYGISVTKALRLHSETLRQQRRQRAEEMAQKAAVKILFPTLLCIFPAIFIVILGPAALQIMTTLSRPH